MTQTLNQWLKKYDEDRWEEWEEFKAEHRRKVARESAKKIYHAGKKALKKNRDK